jgi:hypothetical protein
MLHSFRQGDGRSSGIHRGKLVDGDMRGAKVVFVPWRVQDLAIFQTSTWGAVCAIAWRRQPGRRGSQGVVAGMDQREQKADLRVSGDRRGWRAGDDFFNKFLDHLGS